MKTLVKFIGSFILGFTCFAAYAQDGFKGFKVEVYNVYPEKVSYLALEGPDAVRPDVNLNPDDYCPRPQSPIPCCGQPKMFQFTGCGRTISKDSVGLKPYVIYSLFNPKKSIDKVLTCRFDYSFTGNSCTATATPLIDTNLAHCTATASPANGGCEVTLTFQP